MIENFGRNLRWKSENLYTPESEAEALAILSQHRGKKIRAIGRLHSWSEAPVGDEVLLDLRNLDQVQIERRGNEAYVRVGAGCQIKQVVSRLQRNHGLTLPALGLITEQTIAGATATGTHGSGRHCLSHYLEEVVVARYDRETGEPIISTISQGDELAAAKCSLGCLGIVLSVSFKARPQYNLEQHFYWSKQLDDVLTGEQTYPLQQFYLMPWLWHYLVQARRETDKPKNTPSYLHRFYWFVGVDFLLHILLISMRRYLRSEQLIRTFYRSVVPKVIIRNWKVVDDSVQLLTMKHELFRHIEIEMFVTRSNLSDAAEFTTQFLQFLAGERKELSPQFTARLTPTNRKRLLDCEFHYQHHYPICIRKVLGDDTLVSMTSGPGEDFYAISFICFDGIEKRSAFFKFAELLNECMLDLFDARPHWGKVHKLSHAQASRLYPNLKRFEEICRDVDSEGVFRNRWVEQTLFGHNPNLTEPTTTCIGAQVESSRVE